MTLDNQQPLRLTRFLVSVGEKVRDARGKRQLSLRKLSELTGLSHRAIWKVEHGTTDPRLSTLFLLSEALECVVFDFTDEQPDPQSLDGGIASMHIAVGDFARIREAIGIEMTDWLKRTLTDEDALNSVFEHVGEAFILHSALAHADATIKAETKKRRSDGSHQSIYLEGVVDALGATSEATVDEPGESTPQPARKRARRTQ